MIFIDIFEPSFLKSHRKSFLAICHVFKMTFLVAKIIRKFLDANFGIFRIKLGLLKWKTSKFIKIDLYMTIPNYNLIRWIVGLLVIEILFTGIPRALHVRVTKSRVGP